MGWKCRSATSRIDRKRHFSTSSHMKRNLIHVATTLRKSGIEKSRRNTQIPLAVKMLSLSHIMSRTVCISALTLIIIALGFSALSVSIGWTSTHGVTQRTQGPEQKIATLAMRGTKQYRVEIRISNRGATVVA